MFRKIQVENLKKENQLFITKKPERDRRWIVVFLYGRKNQTGNVFQKGLPKQNKYGKQILKKKRLQKVKSDHGILKAWLCHNDRDLKIASFYGVYPMCHAQPKILFLKGRIGMFLIVVCNWFREKSMTSFSYCRHRNAYQAERISTKK